MNVQKYVPETCHHQMRPKRHDSVILEPLAEMSSEITASETDALLLEQDDTPVMADNNVEMTLRAPWKSIKLCASILGNWAQHHGGKILHAPYSPTVRIFGRQGYHDAVEMQPEPGNAEFLMLAFSGRDEVDKLHQVRLVQHPASDSEFFQLLRKEYYMHRERYHGWNPWWRKVRGIFFVHFVTRQSTRVQHSIQLLATEDVPGASIVGWTRTVGHLNPPSANFVTSLFQAPEYAAGYELITFLEVPRKVQSRIGDTAGEKGWGLYFLEGTRWNLVYGLLLTWAVIGCTLLLSLLVKL